MSTRKNHPALPSRAVKSLSLAAALGLGVLLAACGPANTPGAPDSSTTPPSSPSASSPAGSAEASPSSTPTSTATESAPAGPALCTAASLTAALDNGAGGGAAGSVYMNLVLTNSSNAECIVDGYPGVSMVNAGSAAPNTAPAPIGAPAERDAERPSNGPVALAPGASATAVLRYVQADNYQDCQREQADSVLVYPPSATDWLEIPHPLTACSNEDILLLTIGAFQAEG